MAEEKTGSFTGPWFDKRNRRRKERYSSDPEYRQQVKETALRSYRAKNPITVFNPICRIDQLEQFGTVKADGTVTFTVTQLAKILDRSDKQVRQWRTDGRIPEPVGDCYTAEQVRAIIRVLDSVFSVVSYYRLDNTDAIARMHAAFRDAS